MTDKNKRKFIITAAVLLLLFGMALIMYLSWGTYKIPFIDTVKTLLGRGSRLQRAAILNLRLPRMLVGICVAAALSMAGGILQTISKNDLADAGITGINAGAAAAAVIFISLNTGAYYDRLGELAIYVLPFMAMAGSALSAVIIYLLSSWKGLRPKRLLLTGLGLNAGLNAFITFMIFRGGVGEYNRVLTWTSGSLWGAGWSYVKIIFPIVALMSIVVMAGSRKLDILSLSDEHAVTLGLNTDKERKKYLALTVILAGSATAFAGNVGFLGLIAPHMARKLVGPYHKYYLPVSVMLASIIVLLADAVSRNLFSPVEIPFGITISIIGVPYFIYLMMKSP